MLVYDSANNAFDAHSYFGCNIPQYHPTTKFFLCWFNKLSAIGTPASINKESHRKNLPKIRCDAAMPPVAFDSDTHIELILSRSVFNYAAFWALPVFDWSKTQKIRDWNTVVRCLLWRLGYPVTVFLEEFNSAESGNIRNGSNSSFGNRGSCPQNWSKELIDSSVIEVITQFFESDAPIAKEWLMAMHVAGYSFQGITNNEKRSQCSSAILNPVNYSSPTSYDSNNRIDFMPIANVDLTQKLFQKTCDTGRKTENNSTVNYTRVNFSQPWYQKPTVLLVVSFNYALYHAVPYVEAIYRSFFPHILYCGPDINIQNYEVLKKYKVSFITHRGTPGEQNYECAVKAMFMGFNVDGYFVLGDDVLVNMHQISNYPLNSIWFLPEYDIFTAEIDSLNECRYRVCDVPRTYPNWVRLRDRLRQSLDEMRSLRQQVACFTIVWRP